MRTPSSSRATARSISSVTSVLSSVNPVRTTLATPYGAAASIGCDSMYRRPLSAFAASACWKATHRIMPSFCRVNTAHQSAIRGTASSATRWSSDVSSSVALMIAPASATNAARRRAASASARARCSSS